MSTATPWVGPPLLPKYISRYMATGEQATSAGNRCRKPVHKSPVNRQPFQIINVPPTSGCSFNGHLSQAVNFTLCTHDLTVCNRDPRYLLL